MALNDDIKIVVNSLALELYDISTHRDNDETIYRVSVVSSNIVDGKREAVSMDKCVELTHLLSPLLDVNPPISSEYRLEVGSAGIERKITTINQFTLSIGELVALTLKDKQKIQATLVDVKDPKIILDVDGKIQEVDFNDIKSAKTYFKW